MEKRIAGAGFSVGHIGHFMRRPAHEAATEPALGDDERVGLECHAQRGEREQERSRLSCEPARRYTDSPGSREWAHEAASARGEAVGVKTGVETAAPVRFIKV